MIFEKIFLSCARARVDRKLKQIKSHALQSSLQAAAAAAAQAASGGLEARLFAVVDRMMERAEAAAKQAAAPPLALAPAANRDSDAARLRDELKAAAVALEKSAAARHAQLESGIKALAAGNQDVLSGLADQTALLDLSRQQAATGHRELAEQARRSSYN